jgi:hypothetical protein
MAAVGGEVFMVAAGEATGNAPGISTGVSSGQ